MITIKNTENLAGVTISGDFYDLYNLVEAFYAVTIDEYSGKYQGYIKMSTRLLGLCYDIRHAYQGDREIEFVDNNMNEDKMKWHSVISSKSNLYYKCNYLYPEMFFVILALNELVELRIKELSKTKYILTEALDKRVIWDDKIAIIRVFQAEFTKCVNEVLTEASFTRWLNVMGDKYINIHNITTQYMDVLNIKYINMTKEKRLKNFTTMAKRIAGHYNDKEHAEIQEVVSEAAREYGCPEGDIRLEGVEYPEDILW